MAQTTGTTWRTREFWLGLILLLALVGASIALLYFVIRTVVGWFTAAEGPIAQASIGAAATIAAASITVIVTRTLEARRVVRQELRSLYRDSYEQFTAMLFGMMMKSKTRPGGEIDDDDLALMHEFGRSVVLNGSDRVVRDWARWRSKDWMAIQDPQVRAADQMASMISLMLTMREDFGHKNKTLGPEDIGAIFLQQDALAMIEANRSDRR